MINHMILTLWVKLDHTYCILNKKTMIFTMETTTVVVLKFLVVLENKVCTKIEIFLKFSDVG